MTWLLFFLIILLVALIAYLTGIFVNNKLTMSFTDRKTITGSYDVFVYEKSDENMQDLDNNIMKYKQLIDSDIVADDDAVIELGERLVHQAENVDMKDEYIGEIDEIKQFLLGKN